MVLGQEENVTFPSFSQRLLELLGKRKQSESSNFLFMLNETLRLYNRTYMSQTKIFLGPSLKHIPGGECAAGTLEPFTFDNRASLAEFCYPKLD